MMENKLTSACTCARIINKCDFHNLETEEFMIRAYLRQIQENILALHKRLMDVESKLTKENIDITPLQSLIWPEGITYAERKKVN